MKLHEGAEPVSGYILECRLGRGGFGEVWKAIAPGGIPVALKFIEIDGGAAQVEERALRIVCRLRHPYLLEMHWARRIEDRLVIATSLCDGNLLDRLRACKESGLPGIPGDELLRYLGESARAIDYLNEAQHPDDQGNLVGIQHRDIKPANLFVLSGSVKVADFGLAKILEDSSSRHSGSMTPHYAPPEMFHGTVSSRSDQYSLAVTYHELRCGQLPFAGSSINQLIYQIVNEGPNLELLPEGERAIVARALSKDPGDRWETCHAFAEALRVLQPTALSVGETVGSRKSGPLPSVPGSDSQPLAGVTAVNHETRQEPRETSIAPGKMFPRVVIGVGVLCMATLFAWMRLSPDTTPTPIPVPPTPPVEIRADEPEDQSEAGGTFGSRQGPIEKQKKRPSGPRSNSIASKREAAGNRVMGQNAKPSEKTRLRDPTRKAEKVEGGSPRRGSLGSRKKKAT